MRRLYKSSVISILLALVASTILAKSPVLKSINLVEAGYFLEGAEFELVKQKYGCSLKGTGYGETGKKQYEFYFDNKVLIEAYYTSYRYDRPINEVDDDDDSFVDREVVYGENPKENAEFLKLFYQLKKLITAENLVRCSL